MGTFFQQSFTHDKHLILSHLYLQIMYNLFFFTSLNLGLKIIVVVIKGGYNIKQISYSTISFL
jgi:hypothetical protein